jgi:hypothetical protein
MDGMKARYDRIRASFIGENADPAKANANHRKAAKAASKGADYWTGREAQWNIRLTPELKADIQAEIAARDMKIADAFEEAFLAWMAKKPAAKS